MVKFYAMMISNLKSLRMLALFPVFMGSLSGCVYDRYLDQSSRSNSAYPTQKSAVKETVIPAPVPQQAALQINASRYYGNLAYRHVSVRSGDTLSLIAGRYNVPLSAVIELNEARPPYYIYSGQLVKIPEFKSHRVIGGETLYALSRVYDVEVAELVHFNFLEAPYELHAGETLNVPMKRGGQTQVAAVGSAAWAGAAEADNRSVLGNTRSLPKNSKSISAKTLSAPVPSRKPMTIPVIVDAPEVNEPVVDKPVQVASIAPNILVARTVEPVLDGQEISKDALPPLPKQRYSIKHPPSRESNQFSWPAKGKIISGYGKKDSGFHNDGINIKLAPGTPVRASENGVVSYVGNEMRSFGNLILISHADGYVSTYGHVAATHVYKGQAVKKGDVIATSGASGDVSIPQLHFEIRKDGAAKNPVRVLAAR